MKDTHLLSKFLSKSDIKFIFENLNSLKEIRDEDNIFNRSIYIARREDILFRSFFSKCDDVFFKHYNKELLSHELYFIKYYKGDYINRHNDNWNTKTSAGRLYSLVAQMTPPDEYSGGHTIVYGDNNITLSKEVGSGIIFPSSTDHELTEITEGERFSFVIMFKENLNTPLV